MIGCGHPGRSCIKLCIPWNGMQYPFQQYRRDKKSKRRSLSKMKKLFSEPELKIDKFEYEDMVRTSGPNDNDAGFPGDWGDGSEEI